MSRNHLNSREYLTRAFYLLFALASLGAGIWLLVDPVGGNAALWFLQAPGGIDVATAEPALRKIGATYLCVSLAFLWCLLSPSARTRIHPVLVLFLGLQAVVDISALAAGGIEWSQWCAEAPWTLVPAIVLAVLRLPLPSLPKLKAGGDPDVESGVVKWFDTRKGFGFIARDNGEELFVHYRAIRREGDKGPRGLREGQPVRFRVTQGPKGLQADDVVPVGKSA